MIRDPEELIYKVYNAQKNEPATGDFCELVQNDFELLGLQLSEDSLRNISKYDLKSLVKIKARNEAFKYLISIKENKSKMDDICYLNSFKTLQYMQSMTREQSSLLLAMRTRSVRGIRSDFGEMYLDKLCPLENCQELDSLPHLLAYRELEGEVVRSPEIQFSDAFSMDLERLLAARERLLLPPP